MNKHECLSPMLPVPPPPPITQTALCLVVIIWMEMEFDFNFKHISRWQNFRDLCGKIKMATRGGKRGELVGPTAARSSCSSTVFDVDSCSCVADEWRITTSVFTALFFCPYQLLRKNAWLVPRVCLSFAGSGWCKMAFGVFSPPAVATNSFMRAVRVNQNSSIAGGRLNNEINSL